MGIGPFCNNPDRNGTHELVDAFGALRRPLLRRMRQGGGALLRWRRARTGRRQDRRRSRRDRHQVHGRSLGAGQLRLRRGQPERLRRLAAARAHVARRDHRRHLTAGVGEGVRPRHHAPVGVPDLAGVGDRLQQRSVRSVHGRDELHGPQRQQRHVPLRHVRRDRRRPSAPGCLLPRRLGRRPARPDLRRRLRRLHRKLRRHPGEPPDAEHELARRCSRRPRLAEPQRQLLRQRLPRLARGRVASRTFTSHHLT